MFSVLTFNAGLLDVRIFGRSVHRPLPAVEARLAALAPALRAIDADLVALQEVYHRRNQRYLRQALADLYPHAAGMAAGGYRLGSDLLVLSKHPLVDARCIRFRRAMREESLFTDRGLLALTVDLPALGPVRLVTLHASAGGLFHHPESAAAEAIRDAQIEQALALARQEGPVLLVGDFNAGPEASAHQYRCVLEAGYVDAFAEAGAVGVSWAPRNPLVAAGGEAHLSPQRVDHAFLNAPLRARLRPAAAAIVMDAPAVRDGGRDLPLSDHYGVLVHLAPVC